MSMRLHIVFTNHNGKYYVEEVTPASKKTFVNWTVEKVIDETKAYDSYQQVSEELGNPTVFNNCQFVLIQELNE
jgi:hypothetical protein